MEVFFEDVKERVGDIIIVSDVRPATKKEIAQAEKLHKMGKCPHTIIVDEPSFMYDTRFCFTCKKGLGLV